MAAAALVALLRAILMDNVVAFFLCDIPSSSYVPLLFFLRLRVFVFICDKRNVDTSRKCKCVRHMTTTQSILQVAFASCPPPPSIGSAKIAQRRRFCVKCVERNWRTGTCIIAGLSNSSRIHLYDLLYTLCIK